MLNLSASYQLTLFNDTAEAMQDIAIGRHMLAAHSKMSALDLAKGDDAGMTPDHFIANLPAGESVILSGQVRLALDGSQAIAQGRVPLLVPLLRVAVRHDAQEAQIATFVIGRPGSSPEAGLGPFRLDEMPQTYRPIQTRRIG